MKINKVNVLGWVIIVFLGVSEFFFKEEMSLITTGLGGLIYLIVGMTLVFYKGKKDKINNRKIVE